MTTNTICGAVTPPQTNTIPISTSTIPISTIGAGITFQQTNGVFATNNTSNVYIPTNQYQYPMQNQVYGIGTIQAAHIMSFNIPNKGAITLNCDGTVTWPDDVTVDEAAERFASSLSLGAELIAGITYKTKTNMRDTVFEEVISMAKKKGSLTAEELTFLWEGAKIMDKLKGKA